MSASNGVSLYAVEQMLPPVDCAALVGKLDTLQSVKDALSPLRVIPIPADAFCPLYEQLFATIAAVNEKVWGFTLDGYLQLQVLVYEPGDGYHWHADLMDPGGRVSKIAVSLLLSGPDEFEGGELELMLGTRWVDGAMIAGPAFIAPPPHRGAGVLFPTYVVHQIRPVTARRRHVLVARAGGPSFA